MTLAQCVALALSTNRTGRFWQPYYMYRYWPFHLHEETLPCAKYDCRYIRSLIKAPLNHIGNIVFDMVQSNMWWIVMDFSKDLSCNGRKLAKCSALFYFPFFIILWATYKADVTHIVNNLWYADPIHPNRASHCLTKYQNRTERGYYNDLRKFGLSFYDY